MSIKIEKPSIFGNKYEIHMKIEGEICKLFKSNVYKAEYYLNNEGMNLGEIPESILVIPLVCNILPIIWLENDVLTIESLDSDFYKCINVIQDEYITVFQNDLFKGGNIEVKEIVTNNIQQSKNKRGLFFSGGVDSYYSMISHMNERPFLQLIWGNMDMHYDHYDGFQGLLQNAKDVANVYNLPLIIIRTNYRDLLNRVELNLKYEKILKVRWWLGVQHLLSLAGLSAPCNYLCDISLQYIAATYFKNAKIEHAAYPENVDCIEYFGCKIRYDAAISRQEKIKSIIDEHIRTGNDVELHVCFRAQDGKNCCLCEKCSITILELMAEGVNPCDYGFKLDESTITKCVNLCSQAKYDLNISPFLEPMKNRLRENRNIITQLPFGKYVLNSFLINE